MANIDWAKNIKSEPFGNLLNLYRGSSLSTAPSAQTTEESFLGKAIAEAKRNGVTLDPSTLGTLALVGSLSPSKQPGFSEPGGEKEKLDYWAQLQKEQAAERQRLGTESTEKALLYSSIGNIGKTLSTALGGPSWDTIERNRSTGLQAINNINPSTIQPLSTAQFQARSYYS